MVRKASTSSSSSTKTIPMDVSMPPPSTGTFGTPKTTWVVGTYHVAIWAHPITVSGPAFP